MDTTTKPSREEVLKAAAECGFAIRHFEGHESPSIFTGSGDWDCFDVTTKLERFAAAMYEAGAAAERAVSDRLLEALLVISTLPIIAQDNMVSANMRKLSFEAIAEVEAMRKENKE
ncbi:MAG TPA: hypothetical protein VLM42_03140 [Bryobacteraceae bacterium]|nr:hypothetical protein [Bryobacteraceae bacterium]